MNVKVTALGATLIGLAGCCFGVPVPIGDGDQNPNPIYTLLVTGTATCGDAGPQSAVDTEVLQFNGSGSSINYTSEDGCTFDFTVSGNVGTLSNGPVDCTVTTDGGTDQLSVTSYTLDFSDAGGDPQLAISEISTLTQNGVACTLTETGSGAE